MPHYAVVRTHKRYKSFILEELKQGRLRQGWGWDPAQDLRLLRAKVSAGTPLSEDERVAWRNRRLLGSEPDGLHPGDLLILPNLPKAGQWVLARVTGGYNYEPRDPGDQSGPDYGHIVSVELIKNPDGQVAVVDPDSEQVHAPLRASMRNLLRMWSVDRYGSYVDSILSAIVNGVDTHRVQPQAEKLSEFFKEVRTAVWKSLEKRYHGAQFEQLVHQLLERIYHDGRVEHRGGSGEKGADLLIFMQDALGLEYTIAVQAKLHKGEERELDALEQIRTAHTAYHVAAGVVLTTAEATSDFFDDHCEKLEAELGIDIRVITRDEFVDLVMAHFGAHPPE